MSNVIEQNGNGQLVYHVEKAIPSFWKMRPELELSDLIRDPAAGEDLRAYLPPPYCQCSVESIQRTIHALSKRGAIPKDVMLGKITREQWDAKRPGRATIGKAFEYLAEPRDVSPEYMELVTSERWRGLSAILRREQNYICQMCKRDCGGDASRLHCHHWTYGTDMSRFFDVTAIWVVCCDCHSMIHYLIDAVAGNVADDDVEQLF